MSLKSWVSVPAVVISLLTIGLPASVWGDEELVDPEGTAGQVSPRMGVDPNGTIYALWQDYRVGSHVRFSYRPPGGPWEQSEQIDPSTTAYQGSPSLVVDDEGNAYATWEDRRDNLRHVRFALRSAGGNWGTSEVVSPSDERQFWPVMAGNRQGDLIAAWTQDAPDGNYHVYAAFRSFGGSWGPAERVTDVTGGAHIISVAIDEDARAYAIWRDDRNGSSDLYFALRNQTGDWTANVQVNDDIGDESIYDPDLAVDGDGNLHAVWHDGRSGDDDIYAAFRPAGGIWSADVMVSDDEGGAAQRHPAVSIMTDTYAAVVWIDEREEYVSIYGAGRPQGGSWGVNVLLHMWSPPPMTLNTSASPPSRQSHLSDPRIVLLHPYTMLFYYTTVVADAMDAPPFVVFALVEWLADIGVIPDEVFIQTGDIQPFIAQLQNLLGDDYSDRFRIEPIWTATGGDLSDTIGFATEYTALEVGDQFVTAEVTFDLENGVGGAPGDQSRVTLADTAIVHVSVSAEHTDPSPAGFALSQNYPNPVRSNTSIQFGIQRSCHVVMGIYNVRGYEVLRLLDGEYAPGTYRVDLVDLILPAGIYLYCIETGEFTDTRKMVVID